MRLTYREAYDRIVDAYLKDEIRPMDSCACFIGNLLGGSANWCGVRKAQYDLSSFDEWELFYFNKGLAFVSSFGYTAQQIIDMELKFMGECYRFYSTPEDCLFAAMSSTLDMLKKIHEENGEITETPIFTKRSLKQTSCAQ